jgi:AcrR family transcriptional regulator
MAKLETVTGAVHRGTSKQKWLETALEALSEGGIEGVKVETLSRTLGIARAGFYWHFKSRNDLLHQLLDNWVYEQTEKVTASPELQALEPTQRLIEAAEMITKHNLGRYDMAIRQWASTDAEVAQVVRKVNRIRLGFVRDVFRELGFKGDDLEVRAMLFVCYHTWEVFMFREFSRKQLRGLIAKRIELLTKH